MTPLLRRVSGWHASVLLVAMLASGGASLGFVPGMPGIFGAALAILMLMIALSDAIGFIIPNALTAASLLLGLCFAALREPDIGPLALATAGLRGFILAFLFFGLSALYLRLRGRQGIGFGDVKLAAVAGVWLDWPAMAASVEIAALSALLVYGSRQLWKGRRLRRTGYVPFGAFFAPAIWVAWLGQETIWPAL